MLVFLFTSKEFVNYSVTPIARVPPESYPFNALHLAGWPYGKYALTDRIRDSNFRPQAPEAVF